MKLQNCLLKLLICDKNDKHYSKAIEACSCESPNISYLCIQVASFPYRVSFIYLPQMNKENFDKLPYDKKKVIESAYYTAARKEITPTQFFTVCRETLTPEEFKMCFSRHNARDQPKEQMLREEDTKPDTLSDILVCSGVDIKEEEHQIIKETEHNIGYANYDYEDYNNQVSSLVNVKLFKEYIFRLCKSRSLGISEDSFHLLFLIVGRKILDLAEKMDEASKYRVEASMSEYIIRIENDLSRQLWCLEQIEKAEMDKLMIKKGDDDQKKKFKKTIQEREDLIIKKRLCNNVALAALGIQQKSWMNSEAMRSNDEKSQFNSIYAPFDEKGLEKKISDRSITMKDFVYVLERDRRYNKSIFIIQFYFK